MYERQTYLKELGDNDVKGIVIIETDEDDEQYRVTENRDGEWCGPFWMPDSELTDKEFKHMGKISSDQYRKVYDKAT
jgi:hypothetical protein